MAEQGSTPATPPPSAQGGQTPAGDLPSGRPNFSSSPALSKGTPIFRTLPDEDGTHLEGTQFSEGPVSGDGSHRIRKMEMEVAELHLIDAAGLSDDQEFTAHLMWAIRNMARALAENGKRPFHEWTVEEIIAFAAKAAPR
jgi:hypothetical protein